MNKLWLPILALGLAAVPAQAQVYFSDDFNDGGTAGALSRGWEFVENEFVTEVGSNFVIAPEWPEGQDGPGTSTGFINPPTADGTESDGGYLISDSDAGSGSDDIGSQAEIWAISPVFSTEGASEVWFHADAEIESNNNGEALGLLEVTADGGETWIQVWVMVEPQRVQKNDGAVVSTPEQIGGWPVLGSASQTKTFDGIHGRWHVQLPEEVANQPEVRFRVGWFEPADAWWYALDNILVDSTPPPMGDTEILTEDFADGIPAEWSNTSLSGDDALTQVWDTRVLWDEDFDEPFKLNQDLGGVNVDLVRQGEAFGIDVQALMDTPDPLMNPNGALDGRWMLMLAGGEYAMWQEGNFPEDEGQAAGLDTPALDLSNATNAYIAFDSEVLVGSGSALYEVQVSTDGGETFEQIFTYHEALMNYEEAPYFMRHYLEAPQAAGSSSVVFRFYAAGADPDEMEGFWVIDNVSVTADTGTGVNNWNLF